MYTKWWGVVIFIAALAVAILYVSQLDVGAPHPRTVM